MTKTSIGQQEAPTLQPLDSDLTAIAALTTTAYGRAFLALADAAAGRTALGLGTAALSATGDFQPIDSDLTALAALTTTAYGRSLIEAADAAALRTLAGLGSFAVLSSLAHSATTGIGIDDHHARDHAINAAVHTGTLDDAQIPATIARDTEVATAVSDHAALADPHPLYRLEAADWTLIAKTADESKNATTTVADDAMLVVTLLANTQYTIRLRAWFLTNGTADLKYRLVFTGTTTRVRRSVIRTATADVPVIQATQTAFDGSDVILATTGSNPFLSEDVILQVGASGGVFKLQWAQVTSNAGPTTCLEGSYLEWTVS